MPFWIPLNYSRTVPFHSKGKSTPFRSIITTEHRKNIFKGKKILFLLSFLQFQISPEKIMFKKVNWSEWKLFSYLIIRIFFFLIWVTILPSPTIKKLDSGFLQFVGALKQVAKIFTEGKIKLSRYFFPQTANWLRLQNFHFLFKEKFPFKAQKQIIFSFGVLYKLTHFQLGEISDDKILVDDFVSIPFLFIKSNLAPIFIDKLKNFCVWHEREC